MTVHLVCLLVPEQFLAAETQVVLSADTNPSAKFPQLTLIILVSGICLDVSLDMKLLIILFKEDALVEYPT